MIHWFRSSKIPIFHIASLARSGETLLLRCLHSHRRLTVVHNLEADDSPPQNALFHLLQQWKPTEISRHHEFLKPLNLPARQSLILKQGVWEHPYPFNGIILVRNPVACFASLRVYDGKTNGKSPDENWHLNQERLTRWLKKIDPSLVPGFDRLSPIDQFATFYNRRMSGLLKNPNPIFRYADLVSHPHQTFSKIAKNLHVSWDPEMLKSHKRYDSGAVGHGQNRLDQPINDQSLLKYMNVLTRDEFDELAEKTSSIASQVGYRPQWGTTCLADDRLPSLQKGAA